MSGENRVEAMLLRVGRALRVAGIADRDSHRILELLRATLDRRRGVLGDEHHDTLHPARTLLVLLDDLDERSADVLAAATLVDTCQPDLRLDVAASGDDVPPTVLALATAVPSADDEALLEKLLTADPRVLRMVLAERLDHARHLHLRDPAEWHAQHALACEVYGAVAAREGVLARRYAWWCGMFSRRYLFSRRGRS